MRNAIKKKIVFVLATASVALLGTSIGISAISADAEGSLLTAEGASVRLLQYDTNLGTTTSGIRFAASIPQASYQTAGITEVGVLIAPTGSYSGTLDLDNTDSNIKQIIVEGGEEQRDGKFSVYKGDVAYYEYRAYIYGIPSDYYATTLDAVYYYKTAEGSKYTETMERSMAYVANAALEDLSDTQDDQYYKYEISEGVYSRFDADDREALDAYLPTYTVSFSDGVESQQVKWGDTATASTATKDGYLFKNWKKSDGEVMDFTQPIYGDITLTAEFEYTKLTNEQLEAGVEFNDTDSLKWFSSYNIYEEGVLTYPTTSGTYDGDKNGIHFNSGNYLSLVLRMEEITLNVGDKLCITYTNGSTDQGLVLWYGAGRTGCNGVTWVKDASGVATDGVLTNDITAETTLSAISLGSYNNNSSLWIKKVQVVRKPSVTAEKLVAGLDLSGSGSENYFTRADVTPVFDDAEEAVHIAYSSTGNQFVSVEIEGGLTLNKGDTVIFEYKASAAVAEMSYNNGTAMGTLKASDTYLYHIWTNSGDAITVNYLGFKNWGACDIYVKSISITRVGETALMEDQLLGDGYTFTENDVKLFKAAPNSSTNYLTQNIYVTWSEEIGIQVTTPATNTNVVIALNNITVYENDSFVLGSFGTFDGGGSAYSLSTAPTVGLYLGGLNSGTFTVTSAKVGTYAGIGIESWAGSVITFSAKSIQLVRASS